MNRTLSWFSCGAASAVAKPSFAIGKESFVVGMLRAGFDDERRFIDEIPMDYQTTNPIQPSCDFLCHIAEQDMEAT